ncbi:SPOR domain-containing protein [Thalassotalea sediminis]|uniref:SPOR domain-containing protein n=1 Tax=Thalassotalea sediminis TaxID=1759089 RepID=UPI0025733918|nr:SPOR domain-containing protein [Thalassotalea sediminis]
MRVLLFSLLIVTFKCQAQEQSVGIGINYHHQQNSSSGFHVSYHWRFSDDFSFEGRYVNHRNLAIETNANTHLLKLSRATVGMNFIKDVNQSLVLKAGTGINSVLSSTNTAVAKKSGITPYLRLAVQYNVTNNVALEFGQTSYFDSGIIDTNHSIYGQISWSFSPRDQARVTSISSKNTAKISRKINANREKSSPVLYETSVKQWHVQLGAFANEDNAQQAINAFKAQLKTDTLTVVFSHGLYRVISQHFNKKADADDLRTMLELHYSIAGFVRQSQKD